MNTKNKFIEKKFEDFNGYWDINIAHSELIDQENNLITHNIKDNKSQIELNNEFDPFDYNLMIKKKKDREENINFYFNVKDGGAGRGFGNMNISNDIRFGNASRSENKEFKRNIEEKTSFDFQFNYLDKNFQNPNNLVLPFPRGGELTRKVYTNLREFNNIEDNRIEFNYDNL